MALNRSDDVQGLIVNAESEVAVLNELMEREEGVVGLDDGVRYLRGLVRVSTC